MTQLTFEDYTLPLEQVVRAEREAKSPATVLDAFIVWAGANPDAMAAMYGKAVELASRGKRVSSKYLVEWLRYDSDVALKDNPEAEWKVPNEFTPLIARAIVKRYPPIAANVITKPSEFDGLELPERGW